MISIGGMERLLWSMEHRAEFKDRGFDLDQMTSEETNSRWSRQSAAPARPADRKFPSKSQGNLEQYALSAICVS
jgi:hypothetical protein